MSARSLRRNHARLLEETRRRNSRRARRAGLAAGAALGATVVFAPSALGATYEVNSLSDDADDCVVSGTICLREAVETAGGTADDDTVTFASGLSGTINLTRGDININDDGGALTIVDTGANRVTISGDSDPSDGDPDGDSRIFNIYGDLNLTLDGLHMTKGYAECEGGAIRIESNYNFDSDGFHVVIRDSEITGSLAKCGNGGGIVAFADKYSSLEIHSSTISGNHAEGDGGGIYFHGSDKYENGQGDPGTLFVSNSTVSGNLADEGGGIALDIRSNANFDSEDRAPGLSGTLPSGGAVDISNTTVASNYAGDTEGGGGIYLTFNEQKRAARSATGAVAEDPTISDDRNAIVLLSSTIVADNTASNQVLSRSDATAGAAVSNDLATGSSADNPAYKLTSSLVETTPDAIVIEDPAGSNIRNTDPALAPLADNGGVTLTHLPANSSPAVDAGIANGLTNDQRKLTRTVDRPVANNPFTDGTDIGSVEIQADSPPPPPPAPEPDPTPIPDQPIRPPLRAAPDGCTLPLVAAGLRYAGDSTGENVDGTDGNDIIRGFNGDDVINGKPGDDCLTGDNDEDIVNGEDGDDFGRGGADVDLMDGGPGDDDFGSGSGEDVVALGTGDDRGVLGGGNDKGTGDTGNDLIRGRSGDDKINGDEGKDNVKGGRDDDRIKGGDGNDDMRGGFGSDLVIGGPGADIIDCGKGNDVAKVDADDKVSRDCEVVKGL